MISFLKLLYWFRELFYSIFSNKYKLLSRTLTHSRIRVHPHVFVQLLVGDILAGNSNVLVLGLFYREILVNVCLVTSLKRCNFLQAV